MATTEYVYSVKSKFLRCVQVRNSMQIDSAHLLSTEHWFHRSVLVSVTSFIVAVRRLWNTIPANLRWMTSCGQFGRRLQTYLFRNL